MTSDPQNIQPEEIDPQVYALYDEYVHSQMTRKNFMQRLLVFTTATMSVNTLADYLMPKYAEAVQVKADDSRLRNEYIDYTSARGAGSMKGLMSRPAQHKKGQKWPGVIVVHENRGLTPHIEDVARRLGLANYLTLAPDALTPLGGYPGTDDAGKVLQSQRDRDAMLEDFIAAYHHLATHPECTGKVGVVGFCFGGYIANAMAVRLPHLAAAVPFYGSQPSAEETAQIQAPLLLHYAAEDERVNKGWPAYEAALKQHQKNFTAHVYPGVQHGFHNDSTPRYDRAAAELAWKRTLAFFETHLR